MSGHICGTDWRWCAVDPSFSESLLYTVVLGRYVAPESFRTEENWSSSRALRIASPDSSMWGQVAAEDATVSRRMIRATRR
jgi:hypothetical protein